MSLLFLAIALVLSVLLRESGVAAIVRSVLFIPFFASAFGAYQGLFRTCTVAARQGVRVTDQGEEVIADPAERSRRRVEGRRILLGSLATAAAATALVVLLP